MKSTIQPLFLLIISTLLVSNLTGCKSTKDISRNQSKSSYENFESFYDKFHTDSIFQMKRIKFPLGGMSIDGDTEKKWTRDNWMLMKVRIFDIDTKQYKVSYTKTDKAFRQKVWIEDSGFSSECRFEIIDKKWFLVYVLDLNL